MVPESEAQLPKAYLDQSMMAGMGRTHRYFKGAPLYPFGFGLGYATFEYSDLTVGVAPHTTAIGADAEAHRLRAGKPHGTSTGAGTAFEEIVNFSHQDFECFEFKCNCRNVYGPDMATIGTP